MGPEVYLTRRAIFAAAHRLYRTDLSDAENTALFGKCATPGGHGHNYVVEVTVVGPVDPATGMVVDLKEIKRVLHDEIVDKWDHRDLNHDVPMLAGIQPTAENLAIVIWNALDGRIKGARLHRVRLTETDNNRVDYFGPPRKGGAV
jgi:6-pyruvoyltetrahydropterin/6-carboxytetrahydropterin synthase